MKEEISAKKEALGGLFFQIFSPEGLILLTIAFFLDFMGMGLLFIGLDDFFLTDFLGISTIGIWSFFKGKRLKLSRGLLIGGEMIPYLGALPFWTIFVLFQLRDSYEK